MPNDYDLLELADDFDDVQTKNNFVARICPKYFTEHLKLKDKGLGLVKCPSRNALTVTTHLVAILSGAVRWLTHLITYLLLTTSYPRFLMTMSPELHLS